MISVGSPLRSDEEQGRWEKRIVMILADRTSKIGKAQRSGDAERTIAVLLLAAAFMLRLGFLATPGLDSDGAIFGLMAIHILRGELPIFQWGLQYIGTIESFVAAPLMLVFGPTRFALDLSPVLFNMLFLYAVYLYAREAAGRRIGLWALAFASFPPCFLVSNVVVARGGYSETLALGTLAAWFALRAAGAEDLTTERRALVATGITLGLSFWTHLNTVIYGTAIVAFWAIERPKLLGNRAFRTGAWFLVGSLPFWIGTVRSHFGTFAFGSPPLPPFWFRVWRLVTYRLPIVVGVRFDNSLRPTLPGVAWLVLFIQLAALASLVALSRRSTEPPLRRAARLLLLIGAVFFAVYLASPYSGIETQRYLIPLYTVLCVAPALLIACFQGAASRAGVAVGVVVLALQAVPMIATMKIFNPADLRLYRHERMEEARLLGAIEGLGLKTVYADDYWDGARFTFDEVERVVFPNPFDDRNHAYLDATDAAARPAFLFHFPENASAFMGTLKLAGARFQKRNIGDYRLFYDIQAAPGDGPRLSVARATASQNAVDASLAVDRDAATLWRSIDLQARGMWFQVDLTTHQEVAEVDLWPGFAPGMPRGLRVEASADGEIWTTVAEAPLYYGPCSWARGRALPTYQGWVVVRFPPILCRSLRLTNLGDERFSWTIVEIEVRGPGTLTGQSSPHVPQDAQTGRLFADPVLAARLPGAVRHWQGRPIRRFEDLRDAAIVAPSDRIVLPNNDPLVREGTDPSLGVRAARISPIDDDEAILGELHLDTENLEHRVTRFLTEPGTNKAILELGVETEVAGVVVEHREAASSFPRGLVARTSADGATWSEAEALEPRPSALFWSDEGLMGSSFTERTFVFRTPRSARFVELTASPRHPLFPWIVSRAAVLVPRAASSSSFASNP
jgi:F5/8 type C domain/Dolichyl-phosphate-mannose-protein mannosyltransferase